MKKVFLLLFLTFVATVDGFTQTMGLQTVEQMRPSPAGSKVLRLVDLINSNKEVTENDLQIFSKKLVEKYKPEGLINIIKSIREKDGQLTVYQVNRKAVGEFILLSKTNRDRWVEFKVLTEDDMPYGITGIGIDIADPLNPPSTPIYTSATTTDSSPKSPQRLSKQELASRIDQLMQVMIEKRNLSGIIMFTYNGAPLYEKIHGYADWEKKTSITKETLFNIGSLNKRFTAEVIHQLVKEGKLNYSDNISKYLPDFPQDKASKITIEHLLQHSSGLGNYIMTLQSAGLRGKDLSISDLMKFIKEENLAFEPGSKRSYSNSGYVVLGSIIEAITGKSYLDNLRERIFKPLGLQNVAYTKQEKLNAKHKATGYRMVNGERQAVADTVTASPAGGMFMNIRELYTFAHAMNTGNLPSKYNYGKRVPLGGTDAWNAAAGAFNNEIEIVALANTGSVIDELVEKITGIVNGG